MQIERVLLNFAYVHLRVHLRNLPLLTGSVCERKNILSLHNTGIYVVEIRENRGC